MRGLTATGDKNRRGHRVQRTYQILSSVPGIGDGVAFTLLGELPKLGKLSNRKVAALRGLAPL
ncbi:MAG: transposase [Pseudomonadales bacterium]|nr:transposase [Pseudomonadales bacterium]